MSPPFELYVAVRYLLARRKQAFISLISGISTLGVGVGVMAVIIALALMTGLQQELRDRIVGSAAHVYVWKLGEDGIADYEAEAANLLGHPRVLGAAPVVLGRALLTTGRGEAFVTIKGIDPELEQTVTEIGRSMETGRLDALSARSAEGLEGIVIGRDLALQLGAFVGDTVTVLTPQGTLSPVGMMPRMRRLEVVGTFSLGLFEFDTAYGYVSLDLGQRLLQKDRIDLIELRVDNMFAAPGVAEELGHTLGAGYLTQDWSELNRSLFSALWLEKVAISFTIGLIIMVAALNIVASLILLVMEKTRDIAILKTMGASSRSIMLIFLMQGLIIGTAGTAAGAAAGWGVSRILDHYQVIRVPMDVYQIAYVPFTVQPLDFAIVIGAAVLICFLATIYPSRQASRLDPAQALRYG